jgi:hypothetical protein
VRHVLKEKCVLRTPGASQGTNYSIVVLQGMNYSIVVLQQWSLQQWSDFSNFTIVVEQQWLNGINNGKFSFFFNNNGSETMGRSRCCCKINTIVAVNNNGIVLKMAITATMV